MSIKEEEIIDFNKYKQKQIIENKEKIIEQTIIKLYQFGLSRKEVWEIIDVFEGEEKITYKEFKKRIEKNIKKYN